MTLEYLEELEDTIAQHNPTMADEFRHVASLIAKDGDLAQTIGLAVWYLSKINA